MRTRTVVIMGLAAVLGMVALSAAAQSGPVGAPGSPGSAITSLNTAEYLGNLYLWFLAFVGIAAFFAIVYGGILYMFSGPNITKVDQAKTQIQNAIFGILLAAASYILLNAINPDLVKHNFNLDCSIKNALTPGSCSTP